MSAEGLRSTINRKRPILVPIMRGFARGVVRRRAEFRHHVVREAWTVAKRFGAEGVENIELREIPCVQDVVVEGYIDDYQRLVIAALARGLECQTFFEIGTSSGRTSWILARTNPDLWVFTLDLPPGSTPQEAALNLGPDDRVFLRDATCGHAFHGTPEATRIEQLSGDSGTFDFSPWEGKIDFVYVDGAHTYEYVKSDTENALRMLSPTGTIVWDDYTTGDAVYNFITDLAPALDRTVYHVFGTRMVIYSRRDFVHRLPFSNFTSIPAV
jgi:predicted O-methyltransferase YrrM